MKPYASSVETEAEHPTGGMSYAAASSMVNVVARHLCRGVENYLGDAALRRLNKDPRWVLGQ